ncbi:MAG TPA: hypothetical protein VHE81_04075 [Lacipirellulaceae bacterium]|nr:hypothetical protein [Lacipirellulaceae bacterium]
MHRSRGITSGYCRIAFFTAAAGLPLILGCGDGKIARYPVRGKILVDGRPAEGAMVIFCPVGGSPEFQHERPFGVADAEGKFELRTFQPGDGAPAGEYKVMARWLAPKSRAAVQSADQDRGAGGSPDILGGRYFNPNTTPLTAKVEKQSNELAPFELKSRGT